jgi:hypothetical protein
VGDENSTVGTHYQVTGLPFPITNMVNFVYGTSRKGGSWLREFGSLSQSKTTKKKKKERREIKKRKKGVLCLEQCRIETISKSSQG